MRTQQHLLPEIFALSLVVLDAGIALEVKIIGVGFVFEELVAGGVVCAVLESVELGFPLIAHLSLFDEFLKVKGSIVDVGLLLRNEIACMRGILKVTGVDVGVAHYL